MRVPRGVLLMLARRAWWLNLTGLPTHRPELESINPILGEHKASEDEL